MTTISYKPLADFPGWSSSGSEGYVTDLIERYSCKTILEVGAGANPTLSAAYVQEQRLSYTISDVEASELTKAGHGFDQIVLDLAKPAIDRELAGSFDCVFSRMAGEHISNGRQFHKNIHDLLRPRGIAVHCFSALGSIPFLANYLLPEIMARGAYQMVGPRDEYQHRKFPARYSWCRGPSKKMIRNFQELGFEVLNYDGYFGHNYYIKVPFLNKAEALKAKFLLRNPFPYFCSYASVVLQKRRDNLFKDVSQVAQTTSQQTSK